MKPLRGFSPIFVIVILIALAGLFLFILQSSSNKTKSTPVQEQSAQEPELDKYETESFVFYYPKNLVTNIKAKNPTILASYTTLSGTYADIGYGINLTKNKDKRAIQTDESCKASSIDKSTADVNKTKLLIAKAIDKDKFFGCEIKYSNSFEDAAVSDSAIFYYKWLENKNDDTLYKAYAIYFNSEKDPYKNSLDQSISQFTLK